MSPAGNFPRNYLKKMELDMVKNAKNHKTFNLNFWFYGKSLMNSRKTFNCMKCFNWKIQEIKVGFEKPYFFVLSWKTNFQSLLNFWMSSKMKQFTSLPLCQTFKWASHNFLITKSPLKDQKIQKAKKYCTWHS